MTEYRTIHNPSSSLIRKMIADGWNLVKPVTLHLCNPYNGVPLNRKVIALIFSRLTT